MDDGDIGVYLYKECLMPVKGSAAGHLEGVFYGINKKDDPSWPFTERKVLIPYVKPARKVQR